MRCKIDTENDEYALTDKAVLEHIGVKLKKRRLQKNISQQALARRSGVALSSVIGLEQGKNVGVVTLISILRGLEAFDFIEPFLSDPEISPREYAMLMEERKTRKRASKKGSEAKSYYSSPW